MRDSHVQAFELAGAQLLQQDGQFGLDVADRYVWVYTEHPRWWTNDRLPPAYLEALRQASAHV